MVLYSEGLQVVEGKSSRVGVCPRPPAMNFPLLWSERIKVGETLRCPLTLTLSRDGEREQQSVGEGLVRSQPLFPAMGREDLISLCFPAASEIKHQCRNPDPAENADPDETGCQASYECYHAAYC